MFDFNISEENSDCDTRGKEGFWKMLPVMGGLNSAEFVWSGLKARTI